MLPAIWNELSSISIAVSRTWPSSTKNSSTRNATSVPCSAIRRAAAALETGGHGQENRQRADRVDHDPELD